VTGANPAFAASARTVCPPGVSKLTTPSAFRIRTRSLAEARVRLSAVSCGLSVMPEGGEAITTRLRIAGGVGPCGHFRIRTTESA
jgi:hypothetical protein